jgi:Family of unknown function (DUF5681)
MAENAAAKQPKRGAGRPFRPGQSGNPAGKRPGTRNRVTMLAERLLDGEAEAIVRKAIELAKTGDNTAMRLCLERILPVRKGRPVALNLPSMKSAADLPAVIGAVARAVAAGDLTPDEGPGAGLDIRGATARA